MRHKLHGHKMANMVSMIVPAQIDRLVLCTSYEIMTIMMIKFPKGKYVEVFRH